MRIAIFAHSTNPRGGVVHALHLAEALADAGQDATLLVPSLPGATLFRRAGCAFIPIPAEPVTGVAEMVATRIDEIAEFLASSGAPRFDLFHAQDPITANALANLVERGVIDGFIRTVHHLDRYEDPRLTAWQDRAVHQASQLCCVSRVWQRRLHERFGRDPVIVGNGVDTRRFTTGPPASGDLRARLGLPQAGRVLLAVGGVEPRKNTLNILRAFRFLQADYPDLRLLIAGGATLLDHSGYRAAFAQMPAADAVHLAGIIPDADMPSLYRLAEALVFPSIEEGFGLCALEAMASGVPVIVSDRAPFTEHFAAGDCLFTDPDDPDAIAGAMVRALDPATAGDLRRRGPRVASRFGWDRVAAAHLPIYRQYKEESASFLKKRSKKLLFPLVSGLQQAPP